MPIIQVKRLISNLNTERRLRFIQKKDDATIKKYRESVGGSFKYKYSHILLTGHNWNNIRNEIQSIIGQDKNSKRRVVLYFLKSLELDFDELVFFKKDGDGEYKFYKKINSYIQTLYSAIECITNIFNFHADSDTTMAYIKIMMKLRNEIIIFCSKVENNNLDIWTNNIEGMLYNIEDKIFENIYRTININMSDLSNISDLIVFLKSFRRKISSQKLCSIIDNNKLDYFTLCSVAYYILDLSSKTYIMKNFQVALKKLYDTVFEFLDSYKFYNKKRLYDAKFFYILNDFSYYPPFMNDVTHNIELKNMKADEMNKFGGPSSPEYNIYDLLSKESYYNWNLKEIDFERLVLNKISLNEPESACY